MHLISLEDSRDWCADWRPNKYFFFASLPTLPPPASPPQHSHSNPVNENLEHTMTHRTHPHSSSTSPARYNALETRGLSNTPELWRSSNWCWSVTDRDGSSLCFSLVTVCQFAMDLEILITVLWCMVKMSVDRPDRDGSQWPVTSAADGDVWWRFVSSRWT